MSKMEYLNSFFINRLIAVAGEIFEVVRDTVSEYQEEIERSKQENRRLMSILTEINANVSNERQMPGSQSHNLDVQARYAIGVTSEQQNFNQDPLGTDPSLIQLKLELATMKEEADTQLNEERSSISSCAKSSHDTQTSHAEGVLDQQNPCQRPQDSKASLIQVKLELGTIEDEMVPQQQLIMGKHNDHNPAELGSFTALDVNKRNGDLCTKSFISVQLEPCDSEAVCCDNTDISATVIESVERHNVNTMNCKQIYDKLSSATARSQSRLSNKLFGGGVHRETFGNAFSAEKLRNTACQNQKPYCCDLCGKCYGYARVLKVHLKTHTAERPFRCSTCGKSFKLKNHLKDHERTHTGDKRYSCSACGMSFIWTNQVKVHIRNHHQGQPATVINKSVRKRGKRDMF